MPITKSAQKALRSDCRKRAVNQITIGKYKEAVKEVRKAISVEKIDEAKKLLPNAYKQLDKAVKKNIIHKNKSARLKSRLSKAIEKIGKNNE